ncbi:uncharacterized protein LOC107761162 [Nicotiana tabacum]|uniref:Uncharacterized protein LOC107761162 n=1 Tax=Nicotiana tabacum TaxID=4097 RepID=A0A1S3X4B1_TOBAC
MKNTSSDTFSCGIEKLTSGVGGYSNYSNIVVVNELGNRLKNLRDDCSLMDSDGGLTKGSNQCLRTWGSLASQSKNNLMKVEADICRFSMLILLTSQRISDESWINEIFHCLGDNSLPLVSSRDETGSETRHRTKFKRDLGILIGGIVGLVVIIIIGVWILLKRKNEVKPSSGRYISDGSYSEESSYRKLSLKEIYFATDNLSMSNFIGQGIAGKVYKGIRADGQYVAIKHIIKDEQMETLAKNLTKGGNIKEFVDPKMEGKFSMEAFELILKLALVSIGLKQQRPSMEQVVVKLEEALDLSTRVDSVHF